MTSPNYNRTETEDYQGMDIEKHIPTIIGALLIGLIAWVGLSVTNSRESIAELKVETRAMKTIMSDLKEELKDSRTSRYTKSEALKDQAYIQEQFRSIKVRINRLESANK